MDQIQKNLLAEIAGLHEEPAGAIISGSTERQQEEIQHPILI